MFNVDGILFWDTPEFPTIIPQADDQRHTVSSEEQGRLDLIAHDYYGDAELWWVICLANNMINPTTFGLGDTLIIPSPRYVRSEVLSFVRK